MVKSGAVSRVVCPPLGEIGWTEAKDAGVEVEPLPSGLLAERIRAAGAGIGAFLAPSHVDEQVDTGEERQELDGQLYVVEAPLRADFALLRAHKADTLGNLVYGGSARNWNPIMATAATTVVVDVDEIVEAGDLDPEAVITPGIFVDRIMCIP